MVECGGLENRCPRKRVRGSNPLVSASFFIKCKPLNPKRREVCIITRKETRIPAKRRLSWNLYPEKDSFREHVYFSEKFNVCVILVGLKMFYVYILVNESKTKTYVGSTENLISDWKSIILVRSNHQSRIVLIRFCTGKNSVHWPKLEEEKLIIKVHLAEENCLPFCREIIRDFGEPATSSKFEESGEASPNL